MPSLLENLCGPGQPLRQEPPDAREFAGLMQSGLKRLTDAQNEANSLESRFDLAYNAAHALRLAAFWKLIEMPLPRLQVVGTAASEFVYTIGWDTSVRADDVRRYQRGDHSSFDNRILLKPGVGWNLKQLNGVLRPLIQRQWAAMVGKLNDHDDARLEEFLFGADRVMTGRVRRAVWEIQRVRCFYCQASTAVDRSELDHFIPWAWYPDKGLVGDSLGKRGPPAPGAARRARRDSRLPPACRSRGAAGRAAVG